MWYFAWVLGIGLAVGVAVLNGIWHEFHTDANTDHTVQE